MQSPVDRRMRWLWHAIIIFAGLLALGATPVHAWNSRGTNCNGSLPCPRWVGVTVTTNVSGAYWGVSCPPGSYSCDGIGGQGSRDIQHSECPNGACAGAGTYSVGGGLDGYTCNGSSQYVPEYDDNSFTDPYWADVQLYLTCVPSCVGNQGQACQSSPNSCGMTSPGTIQCDGSCNAAPPSNASCAQGSLDGFFPPCGNAAGWSWDSDAPNAPVPFKIYDQNLAVNPAATPVVVLSPTTYRSDIDNNLNGRPDGLAANGNHAFWWPIPVSYKDNVARTLYGYVVNINSGGAPTGTADIPVGSRVLQCNNPPALAITNATCSPNLLNTTITVTGTATDAPSGGPLAMRLYKNSAAPANLIQSGTANPGFSLTGSVGAFNGSTPVNYTIVTEARDAQGGPPTQDTRIVTCNPPAPTVTISAAPASVPFGGQSQIAWSSTNAASCNATGGSAGWAGARPATGSFNTGPLAASATYTITCTNVSGSAAKSVTVTVGSPPPPTDTITQIDQPDYCQSGPGAIVTWQYQSAANLAQNQWQMQIATDPGFATVIYDSGIKPTMGNTPPLAMTRWSRVHQWFVIAIQRLAHIIGTTAYALSSTHTASTGQGVLGFGATYWARVRSWDTAGTVSTWSSSGNFTTPLGPYPQASFTIKPPKPIAKQPATFTDTSDYGGATPITREWDFGDGTVLTESPGNGTTTHTYASPSAAMTVTLRVSSSTSAPKTCSAATTLNIQNPLPIEIEVRPGTGSSPSPQP